MILLFQLGTELLEVQVTDDREFFIKAKMTNGKFVPYREMVQKSGQEGREADITERIIKSREVLPTPEDVECYIKYEFLRSPDLMKYGVRHLRTAW